MCFFTHFRAFIVDHHLKFEMKLKMMLNLCYLLHLFGVLAITFCSKFQLIWDLCLLKGNLILYNFSRNRENQISKFSRPKMWLKLLLKIVMFLSIFCYFWKFSWIISFSLSNLFFKSFLLKLREGISLLDKLEQIWCWSPFEILKESWRWCWICVIFCTYFIFWL